VLELYIEDRRAIVEVSALIWGGHLVSAAKCAPSNRQWGVMEAHKSAYMQVDMEGVKPITCERGSWVLGAKLDIERADLSERAVPSLLGQSHPTSKCID
jgi:hypothetical protein